jgi:hypothetical protein
MLRQATKLPPTEYSIISGRDVAITVPGRKISTQAMAVTTARHRGCHRHHALSAMPFHIHAANPLEYV